MIGNRLPCDRVTDRNSVDMLVVAEHDHGRDAKSAVHHHHVVALKRDRPNPGVLPERVGIFFRKRGANITGDQIGLAAKVVYGEVAAIAQRAMEMYRNEEIDAVYLIFNEFKSVATQTLTLAQVLPAELPQQASPVDYIFEEPPAEMLNELLPKYVEMEFYRALSESTAAEHAARMTAMEAATSNAGDMIEKLTLYMNRVRQSSITKEIIEVVSGAAAAE